MRTPAQEAAMACVSTPCGFPIGECDHALDLADFVRQLEAENVRLADIAKMWFAQFEIHQADASNCRVGMVGLDKECKRLRVELAEALSKIEAAEKALVRSMKQAERNLLGHPDEAFDVAVTMRRKAEAEQRATYECNERQQAEIAFLRERLDMVEVAQKAVWDAMERERAARRELESRIPPCSCGDITAPNANGSLCMACGGCYKKGPC